MKKVLSFVIAVLMLVSSTTHFSMASSDSYPQIIFINEVMAANTSVVRDGDTEDTKYGSEGGAYSDWIEFYNSSERSVDLKGYTLSDDAGTWTFPEGIIPAKGYLLIWASGKDKLAKDGQLHTNFKISPSGETITLKSSDGNVVDTVKTAVLQDNQSYGRKTDGASEFIVLSASTPGTANISQAPIKVVQTPVFSHEPGFYEDAFDLEISNTDEEDQGVKIYYTTDGSDPIPGNKSTSEYKESIKIKSRVGEENILSKINLISPDFVSTCLETTKEVYKCTVVKAVAVRGTDGAKSKIVTSSYFVDPGIKTKYKVPVISLATDKENLFDSKTGIFMNYLKTGAVWERPMHIEYFEPDGTLGFSQYIGARIHGGYTRELPQKAIRLYADGAYDEKDKFKYEIFPDLKKKGNGKNLDSFKRLILRNGGNDNTSAFFRDELIQSLVSHLKVDTQAYRPAVVFIDGEFWGLYNIRERYDGKYLDSHYGVEKDKAAILDVWEYPEVQEGTADDASDYMIDIVNYLEKNSIAEQSTYENIKTKMDIESFINYNVTQIYAGNNDWPGNNVSVWKYKTIDGKYHPEASYGKDGRWRWLIKDTEFGFGIWGKSPSHDTLSFALGDLIEKDAEYANEPWAVFILKTLLQNQGFRNEFINTFADQINTSFEPNRVKEKIVAAKAAIEDIMPAQYDRWPSTWANVDTWKSDIEHMTAFVEQRPDYVRQHIAKKFSSYGVTGTASIKINSNTSQGYVRINSIDIKDSTPGVINANEWTGTYFKGVPVTIKAMPAEGFKFSNWYGVAGSAQTSNTITFIPTEEMTVTAIYKTVNAKPVYGDINGDKEINSMDSKVLKDYILEKTKALSVPSENADLDGDGQINAIDYSLLREYLIGLISEFPVKKAS